MKELNLLFFKTINGMSLPDEFSHVLSFLYGITNPEVGFLILAALWAGVALYSPIKGPKASAAGVVFSLICIPLSQILRLFVVRPYPFEAEMWADSLKLPNFYALSSSYPIDSVFVLSGVLSILAYYFTAHTPAILLILFLYALGPIYLGVAYPTESFGSMLLGFIVSYLLMMFLNRWRFFNRHTS